MTESSELVFLPLGGCQEIGMNLNAYGFGPAHKRRWIIVDMGVTFGNADTPGIDLITADPSFLEDERVEAIFFTHAHEDHIGAAGLLWSRFKAPMYATPFCAELVRHKLHEWDVDPGALSTIAPGDIVQIGSFSVEYVPLTHSIPEMNALAITTPLGLIFHTGDWKIDPAPMLGDDFSEARIKELGETGVLAMVCDSTNVFEAGEAGSEAGVRSALKDLIADLPGKVAVTTFASNVARVESIILAAEAAGRRVCLLGRSMHKVTSAAKQAGYLKGVQDFVRDDEAGFFPAEKILYLCTGSQGEPRAALGRIARGEHRHVTLGAGDTVVFSSRTIPGNESGIFEMQNALANAGVNLMTPDMLEAPIHVSGHPCRDELARMYGWVRPEISVPVHGERRHILEHAKYAKSLQVKQVATPNNGDMVRLAPGPARLIDNVPSGRLHLEGTYLVPDGSAGLRERRKLAHQGCVSLAIALNKKGQILDGPLCTARGFSEADGGEAHEVLDIIEDVAETALKAMSPTARGSDEQIEKRLQRAIKKTCEKAMRKKPLIDVLIMRV